jgi:hypothetical protein
LRAIAEHPADEKRAVGEAKGDGYAFLNHWGVRQERTHENPNYQDESEAGDRAIHQS